MWREQFDTLRIPVFICAETLSSGPTSTPTLITTGGATALPRLTMAGAVAGFSRDIEGNPPRQRPDLLSIS